MVKFMIIAVCIGGILGGGLRLTAWGLLLWIVLIGSLLLLLVLNQGLSWESIFLVVMTIFAMKVGYLIGAFVSFNREM